MSPVAAQRGTHQMAPPPLLFCGASEQIVVGDVVVMALISMNWSFLQCQNHLFVSFFPPNSRWYMLSDSVILQCTVQCTDESWMANPPNPLFCAC